MSETLLTDELKNKMTLAAAQINQEIQKYADRKVTFLAATKTQSTEIINYAHNVLHIDDIGENRVQELLEKYDRLDRDGLRIHFIGRLQTNKVKYIVDKVCMIHSVDSEKLAREIDRQCAKIGKKMKVLAEINIGREESKGGIMPEDAPEFARLLGTFPHLEFCGIMSVPPDCRDSRLYMKYFSEIYQIFIDICEKTLHNKNDMVLSMGMSDSYREALSCGSNLIRIGSALFGARNGGTPHNT